MAFMNCFLNFNINFGQPRFGFNFGCFSMPNFFSNMPLFNCFNSFSPTSWFQQYNNPMMLNSPSVFTCMNGLPAIPTNYDNVFGAAQMDYSNIWNYSYINTPTFDTFSWSKTPANIKRSTKKKESTSLQLDLVRKAKSYVGKVNSDAEGNRLFSPNGTRQAWCADFVTSVTKDTFGSALPSSFGSSSVSGLRSWAENNDCYLAMPSNNKAEFIRKNVKVGDIMIEKAGGKSHTGIVTKVNSDGSFETVEGNCSNSVAARTYTADSATLSGFISLEEYA